MLHLIHDEIRTKGTGGRRRLRPCFALVERIGIALVMSVALSLFAAGNAQQLALVEGERGWLDQIAPHQSVVIAPVPAEASLMVAVVHGGETIGEIGFDADTDRGVVVEAAAFLVELYNRPCSNGAPLLFIGVRTIDPGSGHRTERVACMTTRPRNMIPIELLRLEDHGGTVPHDTWLPILALDAIPESPPIEYPRDLVVFYVIVASGDALPPFPEPAFPGALRQILDEALE